MSPLGRVVLLASCSVHLPPPASCFIAASYFRRNNLNSQGLLRCLSPSLPTKATTAPHCVRAASRHCFHLSVVALSGLAFVSATASSSSASSSSLYCAASCDSSSAGGNERESPLPAQTADGPDMESITGYLNAEDAAALDVELMSTPGFSLEQLMELAGLSVAEAVYDVAGGDNAGRKKRVLLVCGPGNNGGDGLVAARHLVHFGLDAIVVYPKPSKKEHFNNLVKQCEDMGIPVLDEIKIPSEEEEDYYDVIVDSIFGFSFRGTAPREPFATAISQMVGIQSRSGGKTLMVSVDVPSGWDVNGGDLTGTGFHPDVLISLTAPKLSSKNFNGRHFVGGRFLPPAIADKYNIKMPNYPGVSQVMEISKKDKNDNVGDDDWAIEYANYLAEKEGEEKSTDQTVSEKDEDKGKSDNSKDDDWALEYYKYCAEKEREQSQTKVQGTDQNGEKKSTDRSVSEKDEDKEQNYNSKDDDWALEYYKDCAEKESEISQPKPASTKAPGTDQKEH